MSVNAANARKAIAMARPGDPRRCQARSAPRARRSTSDEDGSDVEDVGELHVHIAGIGDHRRKSVIVSAPKAARHVCGPVNNQAAHTGPRRSNHGRIQGHAESVEPYDR